MKLATRGVTGTVAVLTLVALAGCSGGAAVSSSSTGASDCSQPATTGVTASSIKIGITLPESGALSVYGGIAYAEKAYFDMINAKGGVTSKDGKTRKIDLTILDDGYDPSKAKSNVDELINSDKVFAMSGNFGTSTQLAARPAVEAACVPDLWIGSGNPALSDPAHPLQIGVSVVTTVEGQVMAEYLKKSMPHATVAILAQNGDYGDPFVKGFKDEIAGTGIKVVGLQTYEPTDTDVRQQVTTLAATKADAFFTIANGNTEKQALNDAHALGWNPQLLIPAGASMNLAELQKLDPGAGDHALVGSLYKDTVIDANDPAMKLFLKQFAKEPQASSYAPETVSVGWLSGQLLVAMLQSLTTVDRPSLVKAAQNFSYTSPTIMRTGIAIKTTPTNLYAFKGEQLNRYDATAGTLTKEEVVNTK